MQEKIKTRWVWNEKLQEHQMVEYGTGKYSFTEEDKISIVSEYVCGHVPANVIVEKYHIGTRQTLFNLMDKYVNEKELVSFPKNPKTPIQWQRKLLKRDYKIWRQRTNVFKKLWN